MESGQQDASEQPEGTDGEESGASKDIEQNIEELSRAEAARILDGLEQEEKENLRERLRSRKAASGTVAKDW